MVHENFGYSNVHRIRANADFLFDNGLLNYNGGFKQTDLGKESSRPEEMLEAAVSLQSDGGLVTMLRSLVAAERIGLSPDRVRPTVELYKLDRVEKGYVAKILAKHEELWRRVWEGNEFLCPNLPVVKEINRMLGFSEG